MMKAAHQLKHSHGRDFGKCRHIPAGCLFVLIFIIFMNAPEALAHRASIFAWVEGQTVHTQSKFMGGKRPEKALVEVFDDAGNLLLKGETDDQGLFSFQAPKKTDIQIVLTAGMGHRAVWVLTREDFQTGDLESGDNQPLNTVSSRESDEADSKTAKTHPSPENGLSAAEVTALVESVLDQKLKPLMNGITALNENRISLSDILGGIGYIVGLVGLAAYMQYRRKRNGAER